MRECPRCQESLAVDARVCRHCRFVLDRDAWQHGAGRLGADNRGGGRPLEDPPVGPVPVTGAGIGGVGGVGGFVNAGMRLVTTSLLVGRRSRRRQTS